jgi:nucleoside-diphosphate-sugar epimerase
MGAHFLPIWPAEPSTRLIPSIVRSLLRGEPAQCTHGGHVRDFLYVEDLGHAFAALVDSRLQGPVNLASGEGRSIRSVVETLQGRLGGIAEFGAITAPATDPFMLVADVTRLRKELGWKPSIGFEGGLDRSIDWWRRVEHLC